ncbi:MAG: hypothetical protein ACD_46C00113G0011 [uncultured bacterium]|nr:MAG: hypothetical protein ACD_46C00113G0011 [uncultured bacterium]
MKRLVSKFVVITSLLMINSVYAINYNQQEINKQNVLEFYDKAINQKDFAAAQKYLGSHYTQHNPLAADGAEGLKAFIQYLKDNYPNAHSEIKRAFADGDYGLPDISGGKFRSSRKEGALIAFLQINCVSTYPYNGF